LETENVEEDQNPDEDDKENESDATTDDDGDDDENDIKDFGISTNRQYFFFDSPKAVYGTECSLNVYELDPKNETCMNSVLFGLPIVWSWKDLIPPFVIPCSFALYGPNITTMKDTLPLRTFSTVAVMDVNDDLNLYQGCSDDAYAEMKNQNYDLKDKMVLVERGGCIFEDKTIFAQEAGASGLIIVQNKAEPLFLMNGRGTTAADLGKMFLNMFKINVDDDVTATIPTFMISYADSETIKHLKKSSDKIVINTAIRQPTKNDKQPNGEVGAPSWVGRQKNRVVAMNNAGWAVHLSVENNRWQLSVLDERE